jgi:phosphoribosylaminoimidazole-succinocarboxamide synthase
MLTHQELLQAIPAALHAADLPGWGPKQSGKVRDIYAHDGQRVLITTDRVSAFDRVLGVIPYKGQVLNQLSAWWFERTRDVVGNHVVAVPDPNVTIGREAELLPVEVVVRGYITGVTTTSLWYLYERGERRPYGIPLPDGLRKNDPLPAPIITPTTKATGCAHDERLTRDEILERGLVAPSLWEQVEAAALAIFAQGYRGEGQPPVMPADFVARVAARYIAAYERLTGQTFVPGEQPAAERIARNLARYYS